ncbi:MAG TPA: farnesyl diphosphate synthase [Acidobacteriota bacterium]
MTRLEDYLQFQRERIDRRLEQLVPPAARPPRLAEAMRYTLLLPGKRLRPILSLAVAQMLRGRPEDVLDPACAVELVHASSLILDDLPCMDNAELRRGRPTNHKVFGEDVAVLAAFALLNRAFEIVSAAPAVGARGAALAELRLSLAAAIGPHGLIGGQIVDLESTDKAIDFETLETIHSHKTGALFGCAAEIGARLAGASPRDQNAISAYAKNLGLAFQIVDDLLDVIGDPSVTGKQVRQDLKKTTFVSFSGVAGARALVAELLGHAVEALKPFGGRAELLIQLAAYVGARSA